jgi:uncharacterized protein (DUF2141 family)
MTIFSKAAIALGLALVATTAAQAGDVKIELNGVTAAKGDLYVSLQTKDEFLQSKGSFGEIVKAPGPGKQVLVIKDVKPGDYSVSIWHDINGDRRFNQDERGIPVDGWSMLNAKSMRGAPTWDGSHFAVPASGASLNLDMRIGETGCSGPIGLLHLAFNGSTYPTAKVQIQ